MKQHGSSYPVIIPYIVGINVLLDIIKTDRII